MTGCMAAAAAPMPVGDGWSGRTLPRLFHAARLRDVQYHPQTLVLRKFAEADRMFAIRRTASCAVEAGAVASEAAEAWLASLEEADRRGQFTFSLTFFETLGRK